MAQFGIENPLFLDSQEAQDRVRRGIRTDQIGEEIPNVDVGTPKTMPEPKPRMGLRSVESDMDRSYTLESVSPNTERPTRIPLTGRVGYTDKIKEDMDTSYELVFKEGVKPKAEEPVQHAPDNAPDVSRGFAIALGQDPVLAKGMLGYVGAVGEKIFGEGGLSSGLKKYGLENYQKGMKELEAKSKETDDITVAWERAKKGDLGALIDFAQFGAGYTGGAITSTVLTSLFGSMAGAALSGPAAPAGAVGGAVAGVAGKQAIREVSKGLIETMVAKEAAKLAEKAGLETATDAITRQATKNVAGRIGSTTALTGANIIKETGGIYGEAEEQAAKEGRKLDAGDLARIFGAGVVAGLSETVVDRLGLDAAGGKFKMPGGGRIGRAIVGAGIGTGVEGGQEVFQSVVERFGAGKEMTGEDAMRDYINSFALGGLGGGTVGGVVGAFKSGKQDSDTTNKLLNTATTELGSDSGRQELFDSMMQDEKIRPVLEANGITSGEDPRFTGVVTRALATQKLLLDLEAPTAQEMAKTRKERGADVQAAFGDTASTGTGIGTGATEQVLRRDSIVADEESRTALPADGVAPVPVTLPEGQQTPAGSIAMAPEDIVARQEGFEVMPAIKVGDQTIANRFVTAEKAKYDGQRIMLGNTIETSLGQTTDEKELGALRDKYNEVLKTFGLSPVTNWDTFKPIFPDLGGQEVRVRQGKRSKAAGGGRFFFLESRPAQTGIQTDTQTMAVEAPVEPAGNQKAQAGTTTQSQPAQPADAKNNQVAQPAGVNLPADLAGAKPRYGAGKTQYILKFDSDIDKALYITAQPSKSKRDADYRGWLKTQGLTDQDIDTRGKEVRESIKAQVKGQPSGELKVAPIQQKGSTNESQASTGNTNGQPGTPVVGNQVLDGTSTEQNSGTTTEDQKPAGTVRKEVRKPEQIRQEAIDLWEDNDDGKVMHLPFEKLSKDAQDAWVEAYAPVGGARPYATVQLHDEMVAREMRNQRTERTNKKAADNREADLKTKEPLVRTESYENATTVDELNKAVNRMLERQGRDETFTAVRVPVGDLIGRVPGVGLIQSTAKLFGKPVVFFRTEPGSADFFNGAVLRGTDTIFVNVSATRPHLRIFGHELVHALRNSDPKTYQRMVNVLAPMLDESGFRAYVNRQRGEGVTSNDKILEEAIGDIVGDRFGETEFWNMVAQENPTMFQQLAKFINDFIDQVLKKANKSLGSETLVKDLQSARAEVAKIVASLEQSQQPVKTEETKTEPVKTETAKVQPVAAETTKTEPVKTEQAKATADKTDTEPDFSRQQTETPEFKRWFGDSKVVDENGDPLVVYHGTGNLERLTSFDPELTGKGNDQLGSGFYFTTQKEESSGYTTSVTQKAGPNAVKLGGDGSPGVAPVYLSITNPIKINGSSLNDANVNITTKQAFEILRQAPNIRNLDESPMGNWVDVWSVGKITDKMIRDVAENYTGASLISMENDFFRDNATAFRKAVNEVLGYDGVVQDFGFGHKHFVAWFPEQIKSATGNQGTFDPTNPDITFSRKDYEDQYADLPESIRATALKKGHYSPPGIKARLQSLTPNMTERLLQGIFDRYRAIKSLGEDLYIKARLANGAQDGALSALLHYGQVFNDGGALNIKKGTKGLIDILTPLGNETDRFLLWKAANRAEKLKAEEREMYFSDQEIKELKRLNLGTMPNGKSRMATYIKVLNDMNDLNRSVLALPKQAGLITDEAYNKFMSDVWFVPFYRNMEDNTTEGLGAMQGSAKLTSQTFSKKLKGSERPLNDLLENVLLNWSHILSASMKNQSAKEILAKAVELKAAHRVPSAVKGSVKVMENGKEAHYVVDDPLLLDSLTMISTMPSDGMFTKLASKFKTTLTQTVSLSPTFKLNNLIGDSIQALAVSDLAKNPVANAIAGYRLYKDNRSEALAGGALFTAGVANDGDQSVNVRRLIREASGTENEFVADFDGLKSVFTKYMDKYQEFGDRFENANRLALYQQMRDKGLSHAEAIYLAKDIQDFTLRGSFAAVQWLSKVLPYFNARLQGLYKLGRGAHEDPRRFAMVTTATVLAGLALYLSQKDDDDFKKREDWDRDMYWWYKIPGTQTAVRIRKPFEIGAISSIVERATEQFVDSGVEGKVFAKRLGAILHDNLAMNPVPQVFRPILDIYANKDSFTDRPIQSMGQERLSPELRVNPNTSDAAIAISKVNQVLAEVGSAVTFGAVKANDATLSPVQYDHLLRGYLGWVGSLVQSGSMTLAAPFKEGERPDRKIDDIFVVGNFVRDLPASQSRYLSSFYENARDIAMVAADYKAYRQAGEEAKAAELAADKGDKLSLAKLYSKAQERISDVNKEIKRIQTDKEMDGAAKRMHIDRMDQLKIELAKKVEEIRIARGRGE